MKHTIYIILSLVMMFSLVGCSNKDTEVVISKFIATDSGVSYSESDVYRDYSAEEATSISFADGGAEISGSGAVCSQNLLTIEAAGTYILTGDFNGTINIKADEDAIVQLVLNNVNIHSDNGPGIYEKKAEKLVILLPEGTVNTIEDAKEYADKSDSAPTGAVYAKDDMTITGEGRLNIVANNNDGLVSKGSLIIMSGEIYVAAADDCIVGKKLLAVKDGEISLTAGGHGLKVTDEEAGKLVIESGNINITAKGDGINSANTVTLIAMVLTVDAEDDGIHADKELCIQGGTINILKSNEGLEAVSIVINEGEISLVSLDDGINACGGVNNQGFGGARKNNGAIEGKSTNAADLETPCLTINGGNIYVDAAGDGLDSNGVIVMNGGFVYVSGSTDSNNNATDYESSFTMNGGTIIASGSSGMYQSVSEGSKCYAIDYFANGNIAAGTECSLYDGDKLLYSFVNKKSANAILIAGEELENGKEYTLVIGKDTVKVVASEGSNGGFGMVNGKGNRDCEGRGERC
ncbi:MAG: carbohydrate-binding domain-containing protein, partial [Lachnospiraceae bacterium]|nr:carbohydrate-binding domain-containing protein [Lachnospiraceae bacterium]